MTQIQEAASVDTNRYAGKPLLRLLELYVLWCIDELTPDAEAKLAAMAAKLTGTFGGDGTWQSAIASSIDIPQNMPELVRASWTKNSSIAAANHVTLSPQTFAEMFVDSNFAD